MLLTESKHDRHVGESTLDEFDVLSDSVAVPDEFRVGERSFFGSEGRGAGGVLASVEGEVSKILEVKGKSVSTKQDGTGRKRTQKNEFKTIRSGFPPNPPFSTLVAVSGSQYSSIRPSTAKGAGFSFGRDVGREGMFHPMEEALEGSEGRESDSGARP